MQSPYLNRVRRWRRGSARVLRWVLAIVTAVVLATMTLAVGVAVHLLVIRDAGAYAVATPSDPLLGALLRYTSISTWTLPLACGVLAVLAISFWLLWQLMTRNGQYEATEAISRMRQELYRKASIPAAPDLMSPSSEAERLLLHQCEPLRHGLNVYWQQAPRCQASACFLLATAMVIDPWLSLLGALLAVGGYWRFQMAREQADERARALHGKAAIAESLLLESMGLAPLAASFGLEDAPGESFQQNLKLHAAAEHRGHLVRSLLGAKAIALALGAMLILFTVYCLSDRLTLSAGVCLLVALIGASYFALRLLSLRPVVEAGDAAAEELFAYLDRKRDLPVSSSPRSLQPLTQSLRLEAVTWEDHRGRKILTDASCEIPQGSLTALFASDEESPSAIAALACRLHDPLEGRLLFDGQDIRGAVLADVRKQISLVTARPLLFTGTVQENITCGDGSLEDRVEEAARECGALEAIRNLPQGFSTLVGPLGLDLQPEIAFVIMLIRASIREPSLMIIEEPAEARVLSAIDAAAQQRAVVVIPSALETLRHASQVIVLHQGRVTDVGAHSELLQNSDLYRHLIYMRFNPYQRQGAKPTLDGHPAVDDAQEGHSYESGNGAASPAGKAALN